MSKHLIFGYGSLVNPASITRTIQRDLVEADLCVAKMRGWARSWSYIVNCVFEGDLGQPTPTLFLNIEPESESNLPGIVFEVTSEELAQIDKREHGYKRIDVSDSVLPQQEQAVFTYIAKEGFNSPAADSIIPQNYFHLVSEGAALWGQEFEESFWATTRDHNFDMKPGKYGPYYPSRQVE